MGEDGHEATGLPDAAEHALVNAVQQTHTLTPTGLVHKAVPGKSAFDRLADRQIESRADSMSCNTQTSPD